jgi:hypothetical protein
MECLRCKGKMEVGFVGDAVQGRIVRPAVWYSGRPEWSFWGGLKLKERKMIYVQTLRCTSCGYLESYALESLPNG